MKDSSSVVIDFLFIYHLQVGDEDEPEAGLALSNALGALEGKKMDASQKRPLSSAARKRN